MIARIFKFFKLRTHFFHILQKFFGIFENRLDFMMPGDSHLMAAVGTGIEGFVASRNRTVYRVVFACRTFLPMKNRFNLFGFLHQFTQEPGNSPVILSCF